MVNIKLIGMIARLSRTASDESRPSVAVVFPCSSPAGIPPQPQQIDPYSADASQHHGFVAPAQEPGFNASSRDEARYSNFSSPYSHPTDAVMRGSARSRSPHHAFPSAPPGMPASTPTHSHHPSEEDMLPPHLAALLEPFPPQAAPQAAPAASSYNPNPSNGLYQAFGGGMTSAQMFSQQVRFRTRLPDPVTIG